MIDKKVKSFGICALLILTAMPLYLEANEGDSGLKVLNLFGNSPPNQLPQADAGEDQTVYEGDLVQFDGSGSYQPNGSIESWEWDFDANVDTDGDGNYTNDINARGPYPTHIYGDNGVFEVTLTVRSPGEEGGYEKIDQDAIFCVDRSGSMAEESIEQAKEGLEVYVGEMTDPDQGAVIYYNSASVLMNELTTDYDQLVEDIWDIPGPSGGTDIAEALQVGIYELLDNGEPDHTHVIILLTDGQNNAGPDPVIDMAYEAADNGIIIYCIALEPGGGFESPDNETLEEVVDITGGSFYYSPDASFLKDIYWEIAQKVEFPGGLPLMDTDSAMVTVNNCEPFVNSLSAPPGTEGSMITFTSTVMDLGSDDLTLTWDWGDGSSSTTVVYYNDDYGPDPYPSPEGNYPFTVINTAHHTYGDNGVYTVTLEIEDDDGSSAATSKTVEVSNAAPAITMVLNPVSGDEGSTLSFSAEAVDPGSDDITFEWEFEYCPTMINTHYNNGLGPEPVYDPATNEIKSPEGLYPFNALDSVTHTYGDNYNYTLKLHATDDDGGTTTYTTVIGILNTAPQIAALVIPGDINEGSLETYQALVSDPGSDDITILWEFEYLAPITTTHYNDGLTDDPLPSPWGTFPFGVADSVDQSYGDDGDYSLKLTITDDDGGATTYETSITVHNVPPDIDQCGPFFADEGQSVELVAQSSDPGSDDLSFFWEIEYQADETHLYYNDGSSSDLYPSPWGSYPFTAEDKVISVFGDNGNFTVKLTVTDDDGGEATFTSYIVVNNVAPEIELFGPVPLYSDEGVTFNVSAISSDLGSDDLIFTWVFEYGPTIVTKYYNNGVGSDPYSSPLGNYPFSANDTVSHVYEDNAVYTITLTVEDDDGGSITKSYGIEVNNIAPTIVPFGPFSATEGTFFDVTAESHDQGSDDLVFKWELDFGFTQTSVHYNDGMGPDACPSPGGIAPCMACDTCSLILGDDGNFTLVLTISDDDGGVAVYETYILVSNLPPTILDLNFTPGYVNEPRTVGYWGHQCDVEEPYGEQTGILQEWINEIGARSKVFAGISTEAEVEDIVQQGDASEMVVMAKRQLMGLWLNVVSGKLHPASEINLPNLTASKTVEEALLEIEDVILTSSDRAELERVKDIADSINNGMGVALAYVEFTGTAEDPGADDLTFNWDFSDGKQVSNFYPNLNGSFPFKVTDVTGHSYFTSGTFDVTLTVTDDDGGADTRTITIIPY